MTERLHQYHSFEQQADIDSLQQILDSPLFRTIYNLQESFQQLKSEYDKGNQLIKTCLFEFDINGRLQFVKETRRKFSNQYTDRTCFVNLL